MLPEDFLLANFASYYRNLGASSTGAVVKALPGRIELVILSNTSATVGVYYKIYDLPTAPTASNTPLATIFVPANASIQLDISEPLTFKTGISLRATTVYSDADTTSPVANTAICLIMFK